MTFRIKGLDKIQKDLEITAKALQALDGEIATINFDPKDPISVENAIIDMESSIDSRIASYRGNETVEKIASEMKEKYREQIRARAVEAVLDTGQDSLPDNTTLSQIENTVSDLLRADMQSFGRHIKKLARLLHSPALEPITIALAKDVDLDSWIANGLSTQSSMVGSAELEWPDDEERELGIVVGLIDRFAEDPHNAVDFAFNFYYNGNNIPSNLRNLSTQMLVPFSRDFKAYVQRKSALLSDGNSRRPHLASPTSRKIFVVHGRDEGAREAVARFIEKIGLEAVILHERANQGRTIIEKIEAHGDVGFAVVLLTPDDVGGLKDTDLQPRARQNVLLELGYFIGRLGRSHVCALRRGVLELPSDFGGVVYEPYDDSGGWKHALGRELQAAGYEIDWNIIMRT